MAAVQSPSPQEVSAGNVVTEVNLFCRSTVIPVVLWVSLVSHINPLKRDVPYGAVCEDPDVNTNFGKGDISPVFVETTCPTLGLVCYMKQTFFVMFAAAGNLLQ